MGYSGAGGILIHEKNRSKKSRDTVPLNYLSNYRAGSWWTRRCWRVGRCPSPWRCLWWARGERLLTSHFTPPATPAMILPSRYTQSSCLVYFPHFLHRRVRQSICMFGFPSSRYNCRGFTFLPLRTNVTTYKQIEFRVEGRRETVRYFSFVGSVSVADWRVTCDEGKCKVTRLCTAPSSAGRNTPLWKLVVNPKWFVCTQRILSSQIPIQPGWAWLKLGKVKKLQKRRIVFWVQIWIRIRLVFPVPDPVPETLVLRTLEWGGGGI